MAVKTETQLINEIDKFVIRLTIKELYELLEKEKYISNKYN